MFECHRMFSCNHAFIHMTSFTIKCSILPLHIVRIIPTKRLVSCKMTVTSPICHILTCNILCFTAIFQKAIPTNSTVFCSFCITFYTWCHQGLITLSHYYITLCIYITSGPSIGHFICINTSRQLFCRLIRLCLFTTTYNTDITIFRCRCFRDFSKIGLINAIQLILIYRG